MQILKCIETPFNIYQNRPDFFTETFLKCVCSHGYHGYRKATRSRRRTPMNSAVVMATYVRGTSLCSMWRTHCYGSSSETLGWCTPVTSSQSPTLSTQRGSKDVRANFSCRKFYFKKYFPNFSVHDSN